MDDIKKWVEETMKHPCETKGTIIYETDDVIVVTAENDGNGNFGNCSMIFKVLLTKKGAKK